MLGGLGVPIILGLVNLSGPVSADLDFSPVESLLADAVRRKAFPGCAAVVGTGEKVLFARAFGSLWYEGGPPAATRTVYDLASLTKVVGTTSVAVALVRDGKLALGERVSAYVSEFRGGGREDVTVEHLLAHTSGLPSWRPLYRESKGYGELLAKVLETPLERRPGEAAVYSDLGFILLGEVLARAGGAPLEELERRLVFEPLGLRDTTRDPKGLGLERVAPTEVVPIEAALGAAGGPGGPPAGPGKVAIRGIVHDENARAAGGKTGHAGLFSTAEDVAAFAREMLRARSGSSSVFPKDVVLRFTARQGSVAGSSRALGWDTPSSGSSAGSLLSAESFGHTGFTGTSVWIDPERGIYIVLLANRVYPSRDSPEIARVRRELADAVALALEGRVRDF